MQAGELHYSNMSVLRYVVLYGVFSFFMMTLFYV